MTYRASGAGMAIVSFLAVMLLVGRPGTVEAGILSTILSPFLSHEPSVAKADTKSLHTMTLPKAAMNLDPNPSKGGGDITIVEESAILSEEGPAGTIADITTSASKNEISTYVVREGDTLSTIAEMFNVTVNTIRWSNDLTKSSTIKPGQKLVILPITGFKHTVKKGDTLASVAKDHKGDLNEIAMYNDLDPDAALAVGSEIIIPNGEPETVPVPVAKRIVSAVKSLGSLPAISGYYMRPITGGTRTQGIHGYNAVDLAASQGTPIVASAGGEVIVSREGGWNGGYGNYVVIRHDNGTQTLYAHNVNNVVSEGDQVSQGQVIAYLGSTGRSTGPHVHFEIRGAKNPF